MQASHVREHPSLLHPRICVFETSSMPNYLIIATAVFARAERRRERGFRGSSECFNDNCYSQLMSVGCEGQLLHRWLLLSADSETFAISSLPVAGSSLFLILNFLARLQRLARGRTSSRNRDIIDRDRS
jgi:hypothetical protein